MTDDTNAAPPGVRREELIDKVLDIQLNRVVGEMEDANLLLEFALANGESVPDGLISDLIVQPPDKEEKTKPEFQDRFQRAYRDLVQFLAPVTATSLRATDDGQGRNVRLWAQGHRSKARLWSRKLWLWTIALAVFVVASENYDNLLLRFYALDDASGDGVIRLHMLAEVLRSIVPFAYGGLGTLTTLLRSAHQKLHKRTFDTLRIPEYYNRLLLGLVSGGVVKLFIAQLSAGGGVIEVGSSALAFIAGYNCDFLFSALERVSAAILPKGGPATVKSKPAALVGVNLENLITQYEGASPEGQKVIEALIDKLKERL